MLPQIFAHQIEPLSSCRAPDFAARGVKVIGISANGLKEHHQWVKDIEEWGGQFGPTDVAFPIVSHHPLCT